MVTTFPAGCRDGTQNGRKYLGGLARVDLFGVNIPSAELQRGATRDFVRCLEYN